MAVFKRQRQARYDLLREHHFTPLEARAFSVLPQATPALRLMVRERDERYRRFQMLAERRLEQGRWQPDQLTDKWTANLTRMYSRRNWRVQHGAVGDQPRMPPGTPNPWAMYRGSIRQTGGDRAKSYVSPWELKQIRKGKTQLDKGLIFVQRVERATAVNKSVVKGWVDKLGRSIRAARGERREQLRAQQARLRRLLYG